MSQNVGIRKEEERHLFKFQRGSLLWGSSEHPVSVVGGDKSWVTWSQFMSVLESNNVKKISWAEHNAWHMYPKQTVSSRRSGPWCICLCILSALKTYRSPAEKSSFVLPGWKEGKLVLNSRTERNIWSPETEQCRLAWRGVLPTPLRATSVRKSRLFPLLSSINSHEVLHG